MTDNTMSILDNFMEELIEESNKATSGSKQWHSVVPVMIQPGWVAKTDGNRPVFFPIIGPDAFATPEAARDAAIKMVQEQGEEVRIKGKRYAKGTYPNLLTGIQVSYDMSRNFSKAIETDDPVWKDIHFFLFRERRWNHEENEMEWGVWNRRVIESMWMETEEHGGPVFDREDYGKWVYGVVQQKPDLTYDYEDPEQNNQYNSQTYTDADGEEKVTARRYRVVVETYKDLEIVKARCAELDVEINNTNIDLPDASGPVQSSIPAPEGYDADSLGSWADMRDYLVDELTPVIESPKPVQNKKVKSLQSELEGLSEVDLVSYVLEQLNN